jgi:hypothetical protein
MRPRRALSRPSRRSRYRAPRRRGHRRRGRSRARRRSAQAPATNGGWRPDELGWWSWAGVREGTRSPAMEEGGRWPAELGLVVSGARGRPRARAPRRRRPRPRNGGRGAPPAAGPAAAPFWARSRRASGLWAPSDGRGADEADMGVLGPGHAEPLELLLLLLRRLLLSQSPPPPFLTSSFSPSFCGAGPAPCPESAAPTRPPTRHPACNL